MLGSRNVRDLVLPSFGHRSHLGDILERHVLCAMDQVDFVQLAVESNIWKRIGHIRKLTSWVRYVVVNIVRQYGNRITTFVRRRAALYSWKCCYSLGLWPDDVTTTHTRMTLPPQCANECCISSPIRCLNSHRYLRSLRKERWRIVHPTMPVSPAG